jgi:hypothetical protein
MVPSARVCKNPSQYLRRLAESITIRLLVLHGKDVG